jgi:hypothetical protein
MAGLAKPSPYFIHVGGASPPLLIENWDTNSEVGNLAATPVIGAILRAMGGTKD